MKKLKDVIIRRLTETSSAHFSGMIVCATDEHNNPIAVIPTPPDVDGNYIASLYKEIYASVVPYLECNVHSDEKTTTKCFQYPHEAPIYQAFTIIEIDVERDPKNVEDHVIDLYYRIDNEVAMLTDPAVGPSYVKYNIPTSDGIPYDNLSKRIKKILETRDNYRNLLYIKILDSITQESICLFEIPISNLEAIHPEVTKSASRVVKERIRTVTCDTGEQYQVYELLINDVDIAHAKESKSIEELFEDRLKTMKVLLEQAEKVTSFTDCKSMSITMKNDNGDLIDFAELTF